MKKKMKMKQGIILVFDLIKKSIFENLDNQDKKIKENDNYTQLLYLEIKVVYR